MTEKQCPACKGELELRREDDWTPVYKCLGLCGGVWSLFDLRLASKR